MKPASMGPRALLPLLFALMAIATASTPVRAQFAIDRTEISLQPSDPASRTALLLVRNDGTQRAQASVKVEDWDRAEDGTNRFYAAGTHPSSCAKALTVFPLTVSLGAGESQYIRIAYDPSVAASDAPKECWSVVLVEHVLPRTEASGRTLYYTLRTGAKVYVEPAGLTAEGQVNDISVRADSAGQAVDVAFENTGSRHLVAKGHLEFRRPDNSVAASVELPAAYALPGATARVKARVPALPKGQYVVLAVLDFGGAELAAAQLEYEAR